MTAQPSLVLPGEGSRMAFMPGEAMLWKAMGSETAGAFDLAELAAGPRVTAPEHIHHGHDETFYVLAGAFRFKLGADVLEASAGSFVFVPRGTPHTWLSLGPEEGKTLLMFTPGGMDGFFRELGPLLPALMKGIEDMSKVDARLQAEAAEIFQRYQYEMVGPPLG